MSSSSKLSRDDIPPRSRRPVQKSPEALARERLIIPHLQPTVPQGQIRRFLWRHLHKLVLLAIHSVFSLYLRLRWIYHALAYRVFSILYYHHRTPELIAQDVHGLQGKLPKHLSVILDYDGKDLEKLVDDVAEISCWCAAAGIGKLSVYERSGVLKPCIASTYRAIAQHLCSYYGDTRPTLRVHAPHSKSFANGDVESSDAAADAASSDLEVTFVSEEDGRESLVDLTKTLCDMAQRGKLSSDDVSPELIDAEIKENSLSEPDLLVLFSPTLVLKGYPPWQLRLTEIYNVPDNNGVGYQVFLRALHCYAKTEMRFGR